MPDARWRMYDELAPWWPLLSAPADYEEEAGVYRQALADTCTGRPRSLVEFGSGGGNNASHMKSHFDEVVLVDRSAAMLDVSRRINPECHHVEADMRRVRLGRQFDCVFVHDAVCYMTTEADLRLAIETAAVHCRPGGAAIFAPDFVKETFRPSTDCGGHDGDDGAMRYLEWSWDPDASDTTYHVEYAFVLRESDGDVRVVHDRHVEGVFPRMTWLRLLREAGFDARAIPVTWSDVEGTFEYFLAVRAGG